ncbi:MAG: glycosyltransferase [Verrucomicrobiae bacterium]
MPLSEDNLHLAVESNCFAPEWWPKGVANYARHILDRLCLDHGVTPLCFAKIFHPLAESVLPRSCKLQIVSGNSGTWRNTALKALAANHGTNLAWFPFHIIPWMRAPVPFVTTVHDLSFIIKSRSSGLQATLYFTLALANALWRSKRVLAISDTTASDIIRFFPWAKTKLRVAKHGLPDDCRALSNQLFLSGKLARNQSAPIKILFLDGGNTRKRLDAALRACATLSHELPLQLVVTGNRELVCDICRRTLGTIPDFINSVGLLPRAALLQEIASANILTYLSHYEGFGFPIIEAMSLGTQVVTFDARAEREVGGAMAIYSRSDSLESLAEAIACAAKRSFEPLQSEALVKHALSFSWEASTKVHVEAFQQALLC